MPLSTMNKVGSMAPGFNRRVSQASLSRRKVFLAGRPSAGWVYLSQKKLSLLSTLTVAASEDSPAPPHVLTMQACREVCFLGLCLPGTAPR